ncbi:MAG TPA: WD40 repeat domain-containing serine/threonine-protein kinase [Gemmataceae bacterium]|jgi:WD40 repeat protein
MTLEATMTFDREALLDEVVTAYLKEARAGHTPEPEAWLGRYPELASDLAEFFADRAAVERLAVPLRSVAPTELPADCVGDYELLKEIAHGGMGVVYRARQKSLNRVVALKMVLAGRLASADDVERFRQEAESAARLDHPHIVPIYEVGRWRAGPSSPVVPYFSMRLIDGGGLAEHLPRFARDARAAARLMGTVARAVHHAHQRGILHRDLKPSNVLLDADGQPHVADFGLAKCVEEDSALTQSGAITGTPSYMAPEQAAGGKRLTTAVDVYGLGAILYELLTGRPPFQGETAIDILNQVRERDPAPPRSVQRNIPRDLETICLQCLQKDPARRYRSADALADDLERYLRGEPIQARRTGRAERVVKWARRRPAVAGLALAVIALLGVVIALLASRLHRAEAGLTEAGEREKELKEVAEERSRAAKLVKATLDFEKGSTRLQQGDTAAGLLWLVRGLETAPEGAADLRTGLRRQLAAGGQQLHPLRAVYPHGSGARVEQVAFSPDGKVLVTVQERRLRLRDAATGKLIGAPQAFPKRGVAGVAFSPDGKQERAGGIDWQQGGVAGVAFSPDGKTVLVNDSIHLHRVDAATGKRVGEPLDTGRDQLIDEVSHVGYTPDGRYIFGGARNGRAFHFWDAQTGKQAGGVYPGSPFDSPPVFSPDGKRFLVYGSGITIWDTGTWQYSDDQVAVNVFAGKILRARWSPDGKAVLVAQGNRVEYWIPGLKRGPLGPSLTHAPGSHIYFLAATPDGRGVYTAGSDGSLLLFDEDTGANRLEVRPGPYAPGLTTTLSPDGRTILTQVNGLPRLYDADTLTPLGLPLPTPNSVTAFSPDGRSLLVGCADGTARLHEVHAPTKPLQLAPKAAQMIGFTDDGKAAFAIDRSFNLLRANGEAKSLFKRALDVWHLLALSPGGRFVLLSTDVRKGGAIFRVFDLKDNMRVGEVRLVDEAPKRLASLSADGKTLSGVVVTPSGSAIRRWDVATGKPVGAPLDPGGYIRTYAAVDGGKTLLMVVSTGTFRIERWDLTTGKRIGTAVTFPGLTPEAVFDAAFAPDGKSALVRTSHSGVRLWDLAAGKPRGEPLMRADVGVQNLFYSPDGRTLAVRDGNTREVRLWDSATLKPLGPVILTDHIDAVPLERLFAFSPDGKRFTTIVNDKLAVFDVPQALEGDAEHVRLWVEVNTGKELDAGGAIVDLKPEEWQKRWGRLQKLGRPPVK